MSVNIECRAAGGVSAVASAVRLMSGSDLILGRGGLARLEREHLHLLLEGELLRHRRARRPRLLLRQPPRAGVPAGRGGGLGTAGTELR